MSDADRLLSIEKDFLSMLYGSSPFLSLSLYPFFDCIDTSTLLHLSVPGKVFGDRNSAFTEFGGFAVFHRSQGTEAYNYLRYKEKTEKFSTEFIESYY